MSESPHLVRIRKGVASLVIVAPLLHACGPSKDSVADTHDAKPADAGRDVERLEAQADIAKRQDARAADVSTALQDASIEKAVVAVPLTSCVPTLYTAPVTIGGSETFHLWLDTGSTTLAVASKSCTSCAVSDVYEPGAAATDEHMMATSPYLTGSWSGEIYDDEVSVGSSPSAAVRLVAIESQTSLFNTASCGAAGYDGIVGIGAPASAVTGTNGFFDDLLMSGKTSNVFATELCPNGGTLWLGGYDPSATTAAPQYTPMPNSPYSPYYYLVTLTAITVGSTTIPIASANASYPDTVLDTGSSVFIMPSAAFSLLTNTIAADLHFQQLFGVSTSDGGSLGADASTPDAGVPSYFSNPSNCVSLTETKEQLDSLLPPLTLVFGSNPSISVQALPTESYLISYDGLWCPAVYGMDPGEDFPFAADLGAPVLRSNVVIIDRANQRVGFAPHAACP